MPPPPFPPAPPPPSRVVFPPARTAPKHGVVAIGVDFSAGTLLKAYRSGIFPWPHGEDEEEAGSPLVLWFSPDPRCVFPLEAEPRWSRSLRRTLRIHPYEVTVDEDFNGVMRMCGLTRPEGTWIIPELIAGYNELHRLGWAHSVEVWSEEDGARELVGGIYGVTVGGVFAGESMFHTRTDCSKIAFATLVAKLRAAGYTTFDVQVQNPHLKSLGCIEIPRRDYLTQLDTALTVQPEPLR
ncbi:MAG: leucyl/phenylalanyl-tRNA--protein transferase [Labilithrix sp.]|nr:leucyl/phenylalanyl-tRNA--protein transferase [Labilithrix sp.]MCW5811849.1 leucyl/phenylalanyl-tRNA--protein transferase [Labilithrix sp.]